MKVVASDGWLVEMGKSLDPARAAGENLGLLRLTRQAAHHAFSVADRLVDQGRCRDWLATAINATAQAHPFFCVDVNGLPWVEIDFGDDLALARQVTWPAIRATFARPAHAAAQLVLADVLAGVAPMPTPERHAVSAA